jgi:hypothetical protein
VFNVEIYPNEYEVNDGTKKVRMILQKDYAQLRTAYFELREKLQYLEEKLNDVQS